MGESDMVQCLNNIAFTHILFKLTYHKSGNNGNSTVKRKDLLKIVLFNNNCIVGTDTHTLTAIDTYLKIDMSFAPSDSDSLGGAYFHTVSTPLAKILFNSQCVVKRGVTHLSPLLSVKTIVM